jgi:hypothetical protein
MCTYEHVPARLSLDRLPAPRPPARMHTHAGYVKEKKAQAETVQTKKADTEVLSARYVSIRLPVLLSPTLHPSRLPYFAFALR